MHPDLAATLGPERFLAEIKTTARLQHPHILPLLDSGEAEGVLYYVMPFVAGESLRDRLTREQQLPIDDAVRIARQVADALGHAHAQGIIHRDIKPENILLQEGHALVADFGIALAVTAAGDARMTQTGLSLGTPQYMSPEQAMGERTLDARTDLYALGAVAYEMLTGEPPFTGATVQAIVAKVLSAEPQAPTLVRKTIPRNVEGAVLKALAKIPADRWAKASEFAAALVDSGASAGYATRASISHAVSAPRMPVRTRALLALTTSVALGGVGSALWLATRRAPAPVPALVDVLLPDSVALFAGSGRRLVLSRDGTLLVVVATKAGKHGLYARRMAEPEFRLIPGTENGLGGLNVDPTLSPNGASLLYRTNTALVRIPVTGGSAQRVDSTGLASWGDGDRIVTSRADTLWEMTPDGGAKRVISAPDSAAGIPGLRWPSVLPGGKHALVNVRSVRPGATIDDDHIGVISLDDGRIEDLGIVGTNPLYSGTGHIVFGRLTGEVFAAPFSLRTRRVQGAPARILQGIWIGTGGAVGVAVSGNGTMAYHEGQSNLRKLLIVKNDGTARDVPASVGLYNVPRVSPDGQRIVVERNPSTASRPEGAIVLIDVRTGALQQVAAEGEGMAPQWSRDGDRITFMRFLGEAGREIVSRAWDRRGEDRVLFRDSSTALFDFDLGPAGGWSALQGGRVGRGDILLAPADSLSQFRPFVATGANEAGMTVSPDGRWLAYASNESGRNEVYVQPIPGPGPRLQVSISGGAAPIWSPEGGALFYRDESLLIVAARLNGNPLRVVQWDTLFVDRYQRSPFLKPNWSVFPSGREFLMLGGAGATVGGVKLVVNWPQLTASSRGAGAP